VLTDQRLPHRVRLAANPDYAFGEERSILIRGGSEGRQLPLYVRVTAPTTGHARSGRPGVWHVARA
jgi:hypothetical protein